MEKLLRQVARQPIVNEANEIVAYELLYRNNQICATSEMDDDEITLDVLVTSFLKIGYSSISNGVRLAVNFSNSKLLEIVSQVIPPEQIIFEILETAEINDDLIERLKVLKSKGYTVALDDFKASLVENEEIYNYVDIIKVDFRDSTLEEKQNVEAIAERFKNITLLAEKVETENEYKYAVDSGYSLFQGYYISKPETITA